MISISHTFLVNHSIEDTFRFINNPEFEVEWSSSISYAEQLSDNQLKLHYNFLSKKEEFIMEVETDSCERRSFKTIKGAFPISGTQIFESTEDGGTKIIASYNLDPGKYFGIIPLVILKKAMNTLMKRDEAVLNRVMDEKLIAQT